MIVINFLMNEYSVLFFFVPFFKVRKASHNFTCGFIWGYFFIFFNHSSVI